MNYKFLFTALLGITALNKTMAQDMKTVKLRIIETSDVHGCFFPYDFVERKELKGSLARVNSYVNNLRKEYGKNLILLDNGDILQGQPTCYFTNYVATQDSNITSKVMNYMQYDAGTFGNHDVETGHKVYDKWIKELNFPVLGANIIDTHTQQPYVKPYTIFEREGVKVAVLGMLTPAIPCWLGESLWSGLRFDPIVESSKKWIAYLKENEHPDVIVGLFHSGWNGGISTLHYNEDATEKTAKDVAGFDIIFFGHDHHARKAEETNITGEKVLCLDPSCNAVNVADAQIEITLKDGKMVNKNITGDVCDITSQPIDNKFVKRFTSDMENVKQYVDKKVGDMGTTIRTRDCFFGSAPFTDLIHNLQLAITHADISFNAPLSFDITVNKGPIYMSDMFKLYRYENQICVMRMTGEEIRKHLEMSYDQWVNTMKTKDDHIMLMDATNTTDMQKYGFKNLTFNFDSAAGIDYTVDVTKPNGQKVNIIRLSNGKNFNPKAWYKVVMNSYRANGGGELLTRGAGIPKDSLRSRIIYESERDQRHYLCQEIEKMKIVQPKANNNWRFVPDAWAKPAIIRDKKQIFND